MLCIICLGYILWRAQRQPEKLPYLRGQWRLPLLLGVLFCLAHLPMPGQCLWEIPLQVLATFPLGFVAAYYFLRFRTILPLVALHAIGFVLPVNGIES